MAQKKADKIKTQIEKMRRLAEKRARAEKAVLDADQSWADAAASYAGPTSLKHLRDPADKWDQLDWRTKAFCLMLEHPDWSAEQIAKKVGVHRTTLYKDDEIKQTLKVRRTQRLASPQDRPKGWKDPETGTIEGVAR